MYAQIRLKSRILTTMKFGNSSWNKKRLFYGHDGIPIRYLKPVVDDVILPFFHIINTCIDNRVFPSARKIVRVCPVPKVDHAKDVSEFRPTSILCISSKVFELGILHQLCHYLEVKAHCNQTSRDLEKDTLQLHYC